MILTLSSRSSSLSPQCLLWPFFSQGFDQKACATSLAKGWACQRSGWRPPGPAPPRRRIYRRTSICDRFRKEIYELRASCFSKSAPAAGSTGCMLKLHTCEHSFGDSGLLRLPTPRMLLGSTLDKCRQTYRQAYSATAVQLFFPFWVWPFVSARTSTEEEGWLRAV